MERNRARGGEATGRGNAEPASAAGTVVAAGATPRQCADVLLHKVAGSMLRVVRNNWRANIPAGMSLAQFRTLMFIVNNAGTSLREVANYFTVSMPTASATVTRLVSQGLVAVSDHVGDKRRIALFATAAGNALYASGAKHTEAAFVKIMSRLSQSERVALQRGTDVIIKVLAQLQAPGDGKPASGKARLRR